MKRFLQFVFSLALVCAFLYPRMWPLIRASRARSRSLARPIARSGAEGSAPSGVPSGAQRERIVSFASDVSLRKDTTLEVREEFVVHSEGSYFRWGLIRDLPIDSEAR